MINFKKNTTAVPDTFDRRMRPACFDAKSTIWRVHWTHLWEEMVTYRDDSDLHPLATKVDAHHGDLLADADEGGDYEQGQRRHRRASSREFHL